MIDVHINKKRIMSCVHFNGLDKWKRRKKGAKAKEANKEVPNWVLFLAPRSINCSAYIVYLAVIVSFLSLFIIADGTQASQNTIQPGFQSCQAENNLLQVGTRVKKEKTGLDCGP